jgi:AAA family ATP:ADP antiporter
MGPFLKRLLRPIVEVTESESVTLVLMFLYSFLGMTAYNILKPITRSQFITSLGADRIPYMPLVAALAIGVVMAGYARGASLLPPRWVIPAAQTLMVGVLVFFWFAFQTGHWLAAAGFYFFGLIMGILITSQFWTIANEIYNARQAKRVFGFIGGGAGLGGIVGSIILTYFVSRVGTTNLLLVSAAIMLLGIATVVTITTRAGALSLERVAAASEEKGIGGVEALRLLRNSRHLQIIALVIAFGAIGANLIEQQLNMAAEASQGRATDRLSVFLGSVQLYTSIAAFLIQIFLTSRVHRLLGIGFALMILPVSLGASAVLMLITAAPWAAQLARVADTSLRYTVDKTTREILFLPLSSDLKQRAKPFVDVTVDRFAKGLSALLALVLIADWSLNLPWWQVSYASLAIMAAWIVMAVVARRGYVAAFRQSLERGEVEPEAVRVSTADLSTIETLMGELADPDEKRVLYAIDVLESLDKRSLITPLLLRHESPRVRARALRALGAAPREQVTRWRHAVRGMLGDEHAEVRAAAVGALVNIGDEPETELVRPYLADANPRIAATAAVVMARSSREQDRGAAEAALSTLASGDTAGRREVAVALGQIPDERFRTVLVPLLGDANPLVAEEAMRSVGKLGTNDFLFVPALISLLRNRRLKSAARDGLVNYGEPVVEALEHFLRDPQEDIWVRRHIPATLAHIPSQKSMDVLLRAVREERDGFLRFKLTSAIDRLHDEHPEMTFDPAAIESLLGRESARYYDYLSLHYNLFHRAKLQSAGLLDAALQEKTSRARDRVFLLLGILFPRRDIAAARWALDHGDAKAKANASEFLDNLLTPSLRKRLMPILEEMPLAERVRKGNLLLRTRERDVEETIVQLINDEDEVVSAAAIDFAGRERLLGLVDDIEHVLAHRDVRDWHVFEAASWTLAGFKLPVDRRRSLWVEPLPTVEVADRLRQTPIFSGVTIDELFRMARTGRQVRYERGRVLFQAGTQPSDHLLLLDGRVRLIPARGDGGEREVAAPAPLGIEEALEGRPMSDTARTLEASVCLQLTLEEGRALLADNTDLVEGLFRWVMDHPSLQASRIVLRGQEGPQPVEVVEVPLKPIDKLLALQRVSLFARVPVDERLSLAAVARELTFERGQTLVQPGDAPAIHLVFEGTVTVTPTEDPTPIISVPGDAIGVIETLAGVSLDATAKATSPVRVLSIGHDDLFDLLGQRPDMLQHMFTTLFGARRSKWGLKTSELTVRPEAGPERWVQEPVVR